MCIRDRNKKWRNVDDNTRGNKTTESNEKDKNILVGHIYRNCLQLRIIEGKVAGKRRRRRRTIGMLETRADAQIKKTGRAPSWNLSQRGNTRLKDYEKNYIILGAMELDIRVGRKAWNHTLDRGGRTWRRPCPALDLSWLAKKVLILNPDTNRKKATSFWNL